MSGEDLSPLTLAREVRERAWWPIPVNGKRPVVREWPAQRIEPDQTPELFRGSCTGVGVNLGASGLKDLEADCPASEYVLAELKPPTECVWHRDGRQHRIYNCAEADSAAWQIAKAGAEGASMQLTLVELRGGNEQSVFPGSRHPKGGRYQWMRDGVPSTASYQALWRTARMATVAGALAHYWPGQGARHLAALAAAGHLRRAGVTEKETAVIIRAAARAAGDEELEDRVEAVRTTYAKGEDEPQTGLPRLGELCGETLARWMQRHLPAKRAWAVGGSSSPPVDGAEGSSVEAEPSPNELLVAAAAATGAERTGYLQQLATSVAGEPLVEEQWADEVRNAGLARKTAFLAEVRKRCPSTLQASPGRPGAEITEERERVGIYSVQDGRLFYDRDTPAGALPVPMCNFTARIVAEEVRDDGAERTTVFTIHGRLQNGQPLPPAATPADRYPSLGWVVAHWGSAAVVYAGQSIKDHLRAGIQLLSGEVPRRTVYGHMGWRRIDGRYLFLHTGGAIGPEGPVPEIEVSLGQGRLAAYALPEPPAGKELQRAIRASLALLRLTHAEIMYPLLAAVYRAPPPPAAPVDLAVFVAGGTGAQKSELTAMAQAHFGAGFHAKALPGNWSTTSNSLEKQAFLTKDSLFTVDDFAPCGATTDVQRLHREADRLFRAQGNHAGRGRMRADGSLRPEYYPRGLVLSSGEDVPTGHSVRARLVVLEVTRGDVDLELLTQVQEAAGEGVLAEAMAGYLSWLAPQMEDLGSELRARLRELRSQARTGGVFHDRTPDNLASLAVGLEFFLRYAEEAGAITADESEQYWRQGWQALRRVAARQSEHQLGEEHTQRFLHLLTGVLASGQGHLADASDGNAPPDAGHWGWREVEIGTGENFRREWRPHGSCVGWIEGENLLLQPEAVFASVQRLAKDQGTAFSITQRTLFKRLAEKGLLASREPTQDRLNVRWTIAGERKRVIHLHAASLTIETGPIGPNGPPSHSQARERTERPDRSSAVSDETGPENWSRTEHLTLEDPFDSLTGPVGPVLQAEVACERAEREEIEL